MEQQCAVVGRLVDRMASEHAVDASHHPIAVDLTSGEFRLLGELRNVSEHGLLDYDVDTLRPWHRISLWLRHLALNVCAPAGVSPHSRWLGFDSGTVLHPIADARDLLEKMLDLYWQGLSRPIHFFPKTSLAFVAKVHTGKPQQAMDAARKAWLGNDFSPGEGGGAYYRLMFPDAAVLDEAFRALAVEVLEPMFACEEQE
jgi:exodeoxyribonuclease V gamma subunit